MKFMTPFRAHVILLSLALGALSGCGGGNGAGGAPSSGEASTAGAVSGTSAGPLAAMLAPEAAVDRKTAQAALPSSAVFAQLDPDATFQSLGWNAGLVCNGRDTAFANLAEAGLSGSGLGGAYGALRFAKVSDPRHPQRKVFLTRANVNDAPLTGSPNCVVGWPPGGAGGLPVGETFWLTFGLHLPSWTTVPEESVIAQWHQAGPSGQALMALSVKGGQLVLTVRHNPSAAPSPGTNSVQVFPLPGSLPIGDWASIVIKARISHDATAAPFLTLWRDGQQLVDYRGPLGFHAGTHKPFAMLGLDTWGHASGPNKWSASAPTKAVLLARPSFVKDAGGSYAEPDLRAHVAPAGTPIDGGSGTATWVKVATEFQSFTVSGTQTVRYGFGTRWVEKQVSGTVYCGNSTFGDPFVGQRKQCELKQAATDLRLKPFASNSPWNTPIPANATYAPASDPRVSRVRAVGYLNVAGSQWTLPVYYAKSTDPVRSVQVSALNLPANAQDPYWQANARPGTVQLRMPASAVPDSGTDAAFIVVSEDGRYSHEFWYAHPDGNGGFKAVSYARVPLDGTGLNISGETTQDLTGSYFNPDILSLGWGGISAYGGSGLAGLIRAGEISGGEMNHALRLLLPFSILGFPASGRAIWPATHLEYHCSETGPVILGTRYAIPHGVNLANQGLSAPALTLAKTLQKYGAFVVDSAGSVNLNADSVAAQGEAALLKQNQADLNKILSLMTVVNPPAGTNTATLAKPPGC